MIENEPIESSCRGCGTAVPRDRISRLCPACLLESAYSSGAPKTIREGVGRTPSSLLPEELRACFPSFEILDLLGTGGMGTVYKARQPRLNRLVAIKVLTCPPGGYADFALRFEREAQVMARLSHPHIVTIHDFGEVDRSAEGREKLYYLLMEYIDGTDLNTLVRSGSLDPSQVYFLFAQICDALQYAHDEGIIHRDIKPANILVDHKRRVKIADFGLAKLLRGDETLAMGLTMSGTAMGTPHYMAPEQWEASVVVDHRADIYSLGVVLYEMLTGTRPVGTFPPASTLLKIDPRIDTVVSRAMERDPERRFQQTSEIKSAVQVIEAIPRRSRRPLVLAGATVALVVVLGSAARAWGPWSPQEGRGDLVAETPAQTAVAPLLAPASDSSFATKDEPFENSLGMQFVPVPGTGVLFCVHEVRFKDYAAYAAEARGVDGIWQDQSADGFTPTDRNEDHPVTRMSWDDAQKFCAWLSKKEGKRYRLPTDREWSVAVGIGQYENWKSDTTPATVNKDTMTFPWGEAWPPPKGSGNYSDESRHAKAPGDNRPWLEGYDDTFPTTSPVMSFGPNKAGLYDMGGNVWEWCEDWYSSEEKERVLRGSTWNDSARVYLFSSYRGHEPPDSRRIINGVRIVLEIAPAPDRIAKPAVSPESHPAAAKSVSASHAANLTPDVAPLVEASKDRPFQNSLGMQFVPVPGTEVLFCIHEVRYTDYAAYAAENPAMSRLWKNQEYFGFVIVDRAQEHPVAYVNWDDAQKFCAWLSRKEGRSYRLPTDREWSVAVGLGDKENPSANDTPQTMSGKVPGFYPWGGDWPPPPGSGNYSDQSRKEKAPRDDADYLENYDDGFPTSSPVMSFAPNAFGIYDMGGNVWEWVEDWRSDAHDRRTVRGGSWWSGLVAGIVLSGRSGDEPEVRAVDRGFRIVLVPDIGTVAETPRQAAPAPLLAPAADSSFASKDRPFENSLGMQFVPVPGTEVLFCIHEVRYKDYAAYATGIKDQNTNWKDQNYEGFTPTNRAEDHPVTRLNGEDANRFCSWLSKKEKQVYRLPTDQEWSLAVGMGREEESGSAASPSTVIKNTEEFPWGNEWPPPKGAGNYGDESRHAKAPGDITDYLKGYDDTFPTTAPVMSFVPNKFGLYDMGGNVWEWCENWVSGELEEYVLRGGSWWGSWRHGVLRSSSRYRVPSSEEGPRGYDHGFRIVLVPDIGTPSGSYSPAPPIPPNSPGKAE